MSQSQLKLVSQADLEQRWYAAWMQLGVARSAVPAEEFGLLMGRYREPWRHYHTSRHLQECFARLDETRGLSEHLGELTLALWYHDAIYDPRADNNETASADLACEVLMNAGASDASVGRVYDLIMVTRHGAEAPVTRDQQLLSDIDLAILGADSRRFDEYEQQVRAEYQFVPEAEYRRARTQVLQSFLAQPRIYRMDTFFSGFEKTARENLKRSLTRLAK